MPDLFKISQLPREPVEAYLTHFKTTRFKCKLPLLKAKFVQLSQKGVEFELLKKFEEIEFRDLFELVTKATSYEVILKEEHDYKEATKGTYYRDPNYMVGTSDISFLLEIAVAEIIKRKPYVCKGFIKEVAPAKLYDLKDEVQDLEEINLGTEEKPELVYISQLLPELIKPKFIQILREFNDCFAWNYEEMPGLSRELVEHQLPSKEGVVPFKQPPRRRSNDVILLVKDGLECLLRVGFIRNTGNLNLATSKYEYPMPTADMLVDGETRHPSVFHGWTFRAQLDLYSRKRHLQDNIQIPMFLGDLRVGFHAI
ncbi:hypothetical protein Acr_11g0009800 [Actinidia rufa]|uniref:Uncharacterized protein n=1 Tax=Actinidia rufa TaxID=165716 RepID=A0A7J0FD92_9ERIC|nr:hypothetical protein Acr_11g0009800 [Actinidia rufa]